MPDGATQEVEPLVIAPVARDIMPLDRAELDYPLDAACVATQPAHPRDAARLMVVHLASGRVEHRRVWDLGEYLREDDTIVLNRTRVAPARIVFRRATDGRESEGLCLQPAGPRTWEAMIKRAKSFREGDRLMLRPPGGGTGVDTVTVGQKTSAGYLLDFGECDPSEVLHRSGWPPLPPYILAAREERGGTAAQAEDRDWYQTVYAAAESRPSVAAPTAGLHFTPNLLEAVRRRVRDVMEVELQVGTGTFRPVTASNLAGHNMHREWCAVPPPALEALGRRGGRVAGAGSVDGRLIAVGTTSVRVLESLPRPIPVEWLRAGAEGGLAFDTNLLLSPGAEFHWVDGLMTNFHLPGSTLLALVGAFAGLDRVKDLYALAQREGYRFYSYGDAMLLLRESA